MFKILAQKMLDIKNNQTPFLTVIMTLGVKIYFQVSTKLQEHSRDFIMK